MATLRGISIIIPCYNYAHYLDECIASVRAQKYRPKEIIVVNDGSTDDTVSVCKRLKVRCVTKKNGGLASARNFGIKKSKHPYIMCLDADDILPEDALKHYMEIANDKSIATLTIKTFGDFVVEHPAYKASYGSMLEGNSFTCNSVYPKKMWEEIGGYDEADILKLGYEDWDFWFKAINAGYGVTTSQESGLLYRMHKDSMQRTVTDFHKLELENYIKNKHTRHDF